jgi:PIN domain nuclease of toxin-antitoxin system
MGTLGYLLDTHTFLWAIRESHKLGDDGKRVITDIHAQIFVSAVSAYEISNKYRIGKLPGYESVAKNYLAILHTFGADELPINSQHTAFAGKFEWAHRDPFDRILAAQATIEKLTLITNDEAFNALPWVSVLW